LPGGSDEHVDLPLPQANGYDHGYMVVRIVGLTAFRRKRSDWKGYDLAPSSFLPPYAEDLLAAAQWAWVFGGMGSWNDMSFEGDDSTEYAQLTQELYAAVNEAVVVATNATA
jgi:hypothetical protein